MTVDFNLYVHIRGEVEVEDKPENPIDLLDYIFPNGWEGEVYDVITEPCYRSRGYIKISEVEKEAEE